MYHTAAVSATDTPALQQPQSSHTRLAERDSLSSASLSSASKNRTPGRSVPVSAARGSPKRLRGASSFGRLVRKTSHTVLNLGSRYRLSSSLHQIDLNQNDASVTHLPGSPKGPTCHPPVPVVQGSADSSFASLTPDHSGISSESTGPLTPEGAEPIRTPAVYDKHPQSLEMGNSESKLNGAWGRKANIKGGIARQKADLETSRTPAPEGPASAEQKGQLTEKVSPVASVPILRHRASSIQVPVPRRRSSLTALHLDSSHFEKPALSIQTNRDNRNSSFSASFDPVLSTSTSATIVASPTAQGDRSDKAPSPQQLSPSSSEQRDLSTTSTVNPAPPVRTGIYFPKTFPDGPPEVKPSPIKERHYRCFQSHRPMRSEKAMFHQIPCMTCGIDDKQQRHCCGWCELRLCDRCMKQLDSLRGRPLQRLVEELATVRTRPLTRQRNDSAEAKSGKPAKQEVGDMPPGKVAGAERRASEAEKEAPIKKTGSGKQINSPIQSKVSTVSVSKETQPADKTGNEWWLVRSAESSHQAEQPGAQQGQGESTKGREPPTK